MFIDSRIYEFKSESLIKKAFLVSLIIHLLVGCASLALPRHKAAFPEKTEPEARPLVKIISVRTLEQPSPPCPVVKEAPPVRKPRKSPVKTASPQKPVPSVTNTQPAGAVLEADSGGDADGTSTDGSGSAASQRAAGAGTANFGQGAASFDLGSIRARFIRCLEKNKEYPYMARKRNQTGTVGMSIKLDPSGNLLDVSVKQPSGSSVLDNAAVKLAHRVCPFPHEAGGMITMDISINYSLKE